jgi:hypothetical protein
VYVKVEENGQLTALEYTVAWQLMWYLLEDANRIDQCAGADKYRNGALVRIFRDRFPREFRVDRFSSRRPRLPGRR